MENIRTTPTTYGTTSTVRRAISFVARIMALPAGYRHRDEIRSLTPEMRADFDMTDREHKAALKARVTALPEYELACAKWEKRIMCAIFGTDGQM